MKLKSTLTAINSKRDKNGNCYWALRWLDHETGKVVEGTVSGGESNINGIRRCWNPKLDDWDRSILFQKQELPIREFNRLVKNMPHAGCRPKDLSAFIQKEMNNE